jgi:hypothetical protein
MVVAILAWNCREEDGGGLAGDKEILTMRGVEEAVGAVFERKGFPVENHSRAFARYEIKVSIVARTIRERRSRASNEQKFAARRQAECQLVIPYEDARNETS